MPARIRPRLAGIVAVAFALLAGVAAAAPAEVPQKTPAIPTDPDALKGLAEAAEKQGKWEKALEFYLRAFLAGRQTPDVRDKIKDCLRRAAQARRHRDPGFQQFVLNLPPADALNLYAEVVGKLQANHSDRDRATPERLFELGVEEFDRALADAGFRGKHLAAADAGKVTKFRRALQSDWRQRLPKAPREARQALFALAAAAKDDLGLRNPSAVVFEFLCGACSGLDEYTVYLSPGHLQSELASPILELAGYGVLIAFRNDGVVIEGIVPGSWADIHAQLKPGDRVARVNGRALQPGTPVAVAEALRNPLDGGHELEVLPATGMLPAPPVRLPLPVPTVVKTEMLSPKDGIGYVRIAGLRDTTPAELDDAILELRSRGLRALILDLRGNTGGRFRAGVQVAMRFIPSGVIATTQGPAAEFANRVFSSDSGMAALDVPVVLLIDTRTMSSAEIVAGALKDHNRATLVGMPTFGKGAIQYPFPLRGADDDNARPRSGVLIVTIAKAFSPRGTAIHGVGVTPHVVESDPQRQLSLALDRAVELVGGR
jgi:C-terminal peptidase prc